jgi:hypothetical protein
MAKQYPRPFQFLIPQEWRAYWLRTPALRKAWKEEAPSLRMHDARGTNRRTFIRGWVCAMRAHRQALEDSQAHLEARLRAVVEEEVERAKQEWAKATNIHMLD